MNDGKLYVHTIIQLSTCYSNPYKMEDFISKEERLKLVMSSVLFSF